MEEGEKKKPPPRSQDEIEADISIADLNEAIATGEKLKSILEHSSLNEVRLDHSQPPIPQVMERILARLRGIREEAKRREKRSVRPPR